MASNHTLDHATNIVGWMPTSEDRGTIDILWSCCITIVLCCWVSTQPNSPSLEDKWYHRLVDKANLACVALLGPDMLFAIAVGQLSSARRAVKLFRSDSELLGEREWTLRLSFFVDMGGLLLVSPDYKKGFPINAEQLYYLIKHGHLDFPPLTGKELRYLSSADTLSKLITLWQTMGFTVTELQRVRIGLPITTLEITALSFSITMIATSICWFNKPPVDRPTVVHTKNNRTIAEIRNIARNTTHPGLPSEWYRTPLDFISRRRFDAENHWFYLSNLVHKATGIPILSRGKQSTPWDHMPSDLWKPICGRFYPLGTSVLLGVSASFMAAWNCHFPTPAERLLWRVASVGHMGLTVAGGIYYTLGLRSFYRRVERNEPEYMNMGGRTRAAQDDQGVVARRVDEESTAPSPSPSGQSPPGQGDTSETPPSPPPLSRWRQAARSCLLWIRKWSNVSPDHDPNLEMSLRVEGVILVTCFFYVVFRMIIYVEDFIGLRSQPSGIYITVNRYLPFL